MTTKSKKPAPVKAPVRHVSKTVEKQGDVTIVTEIAEVNAPSYAPSPGGRGERHPRTGRPRG